MNSEAVQLVEKIKRLFSAQGLTLSTAESCTGGLVSHWITSVPGASMYFTSGVVAYSRKAKEIVLAVSEKTIDAFGMVSRETAVEMAENIRALTMVDYSIATTGNLGPDALEGKEKGLVYLAVSRMGRTAARQLALTGDRMQNKEAAALEALRLLVEFVEESLRD